MHNGSGGLYLVGLADTWLHTGGTGLSAQGQVVLAATTTNGYAYDDPKRQNGVFTAAILDGLRGQASNGSTPFISAGTLADYVNTYVNPLLLDDEVAPAQEPASQTETLPLTVKTSPEGARVRIMNIVPRYQDGIELQPGRYRMEVSHPGFQTHLSWHLLEPGSEVYPVELERIEPLSPPPRKIPLSAPRSDLEPELVAIHGGCFQIGRPANEENRDDDEHQHRMCVEDFKLGRYEVTQAQWQAVMGDTRRAFAPGVCFFNLV